jgi:aminoglycoside phosphotransferase (APT) family kinase protein
VKQTFVFICVYLGFPDLQVRASPADVVWISSKTLPFVKREMMEPPDHTEAMRIADGIGLAVKQCSKLAEGGTSTAWSLLAESDHYVLRIARPNPGKVARYEADMGIRKQLRRLDRRIAEPLATNRSHPIDAICSDWIVDRHVVGETGLRGGLSTRVCRDLGDILISLHRLPCHGYGRLENTDEQISGSQESIRAGIESRFQDPWPFDHSSLAKHPIATAAPDVVDSLQRRRKTILEQLDQTECVLLHSDLHERQILFSDKGVEALVDFGEAMIGWPTWDIASFAYFHGWRQASSLLESYEKNPEARNHLATRAKDLALVIALHNASRSLTLDKPHRMKAAVSYIRNNTTV